MLATLALDSGFNTADDNEEKTNFFFSIFSPLLSIYRLNSVRGAAPRLSAAFKLFLLRASVLFFFGLSSILFLFKRFPSRVRDKEA